MNRLRIILLTLLLAVAYMAAGQGYVIDSVCRGAERHYRIDGEAGSTYTWTLTDPMGVPFTLPETADTVSITFNLAAGDYTLSALQTSIHGCDSLQLGTIRVFDQPVVHAGLNSSRCNNNPVTFTSATATGYNSLLWTSNGDGKFNDSTLLHPEYTFGPTDLKVGAVTFTLKAKGFGRDGSCLPAESSITITIANEVIPTFAPVGPLCLNSIPVSLPATSSNGIVGTWTPSVINTTVPGTSFYSFTPDAGQCGVVTTLTIAVASPEITNLQAVTSTNGLPNGYVIVTAEGATAAQAYSLNGTDWQTSGTFTKLSPGTYSAYVRNDNGCTVSQNFTILNTVAGEVNVTAGSAVNCITIPVELPLKAHAFNGISSFSVQLAFDPSIMTFNGFSQMNTLLTNGTLSIANVSAGIIEISFIAKDTLNLMSDDQLLTLNFLGVAPGQTELKWNSLQCVIYSASGYEVPAIYTKGAVEIRPMPQIFTAGSGGFCENTPHKLTAGSLTGQNLNYQWTSPDGNTHTGTELNLGPLSLNAAGQYEVKASDGTACAITETVDLQVYPNPHVKLSDEDSICSDKAIMLNAGSGFAAYQWQDGSTQPELMATSEGIYWVTVTDDKGCQATDSVLLHQCELVIYMPNVFTPNGDGVNDVFLPVYNHDIPLTFKMMIFNKWGEQIFSTTDINEGWDGTYKGQLCTQDMYTWTIIFSAPENYKMLQKSPQSGNVMLLK